MFRGFQFEAFGKKEKDSDLSRAEKRGFKAFNESQLKEKSLPESRYIPERTRELNEAREIFGKDFLGIEEMEKFTGRKMREEEKKKVAEMWTEKVTKLKLTKENLERLKKEGFMVVLRTSILANEGERMPMNMENLKKKFKDLFYRQGLHSKELFPKFSEEENMRTTWAIVKKEVLEESHNKNWDGQEKVLEQWAETHGIDPKFVKRRTADEVSYDILTYRNARSEWILKEDWDSTSALSQDWHRFVRVVGHSAFGGIHDSYNGYGRSDPRVGVCPAL